MSALRLGPVTIARALGRSSPTASNSSASPGRILLSSSSDTCTEGSSERDRGSSGDAALQEPKALSIEVVDEDGGARDAACRQMEDAVLGEVRSGDPCHAAIDRSEARTTPIGRSQKKSHFCYRDCP